jgi:hypothetical protein
MGARAEQVKDTGPCCWRVGALGLLAVAGMAAAALLPRVAQDPAYHRFADGRALGPIANAADVLSNAGFLVAGLLGLSAALGRARFADPRERAPWIVLFGAVTLIGPGSVWYHLAPDNGSLLWDRLPMAVAFAALLVAALSERVTPRAARLLVPLTLASVATVAWWWATERLGRGDLRPYAFAQFYPMVAVPLVAALFPERYDRGAGWIGCVAVYGLAKLAEVNDGALFAATGVLGGHALKHLLAAGAIAILAVMVWRRAPLETPPQRG